MFFLQFDQWENAVKFVAILTENVLAVSNAAYKDRPFRTWLVTMIHVEKLWHYWTKFSQKTHPCRLILNSSDLWGYLGPLESLIVKLTSITLFMYIL